MKDVVHKFNLPSGLAVRSNADTFSVAKACRYQSKHKRFVRCDLDSECVAPSLLQLALDFPRQVLIKESDITGYVDLQQLLSHL